jgi:hypothetical protein
VQRALHEPPEQVAPQGSAAAAVQSRAQLEGAEANEVRGRAHLARAEEVHDEDDCCKASRPST